MVAVLKEAMRLLALCLQNRMKRKSMGMIKKARTLVLRRRHLNPRGNRLCAALFKKQKNGSERFLKLTSLSSKLYLPSFTKLA